MNKNLEKLLNMDDNPTRRTHIFVLWIFISIIFIGFSLIIAFGIFGLAPAKPSISPPTGGYIEFEPIFYRNWVALLIVLTHITLIVNTKSYNVSYIFDTIPKPPTLLEDSRLNESGWFHKASNWSIALSVIIIAIICIKIFVPIDESWKYHHFSFWTYIYYASQVISLAIFILFIWFDSRLFTAMEDAKGKLDNSPKLDQAHSEYKDTLERFIPILREQLRYISIPGTLGIFFILMITVSYEISNVFEKSFESQNGFFIDGFSAGATALSIFFSQLIFVILFAQKIPQKSYKPKKYIKIIHKFFVKLNSINMKKVIITLIIATVGVVVVITQWQKISSFFNGEKDKHTKISIIGETTSTIEAMMSLEAEYEKLNPEIDLQFFPNTFDDAFNKINSDFSNHTGLYDIVMQYNFSLSSFVRNNYVYNPNELIKEIPGVSLDFERDLFEKTWETVGYYYKDYQNPQKGIQKVGYPYVANSILLMYNKKMFDDLDNKKRFQQEYGYDLLPPKTWEQYYDIARFFTDNKNGTKGVCLEGASGSFLYFEFANYLHSFGGKVLDKEIGWEGDANTKVELNSPEALKALQFFKSLKPYNQGNFIDVEQFKQMEYMLEGNTAMSLSWEDVISMNIQKDSTFKERFGFTTIPGDKSIIGGGAFFVNRDSKHPVEAFKFILYLLQKDTQIKLALKGLSSPSKSVYEDPEVIKVPHMRALQQSLQRGGIYLEAGPDSEMISEVLSTYIQKVWNDKLSPEDALKLAQEEIIMKRKDIYSNVK